MKYESVLYKCMQISQMIENRAGYLTIRGFGFLFFLKYEGSLDFQIYSTCYDISFCNLLLMFVESDEKYSMSCFC